MAVKEVELGPTFDRAPFEAAYAGEYGKKFVLRIH
jgi:hypothetical protein